MRKSVTLNDVIEAVMSQTDSMTSYFIPTTGQFVYITEDQFQKIEQQKSLEGFSEWERDTLKIAQDIELDRIEYLEGPSPIESWNRLNQEAIRDIAISWCEGNHLPYQEEE